MNQKATAERAKPKALLWILGLVSLVLIAGVGLAIYSKTSEFIAGVKRPLLDADAGFKKATNTLDPEAIRKWALECLHKHASQDEMFATMPKGIRNLYDEPPEVGFEDAALTLSWGGGFFHWNFYIGNTNDTLPYHSYNQEYPYNFEWRPGIYYTREANLELQ